MFRADARPTIIHLGHDSHHGSSHLPAISPSRIIDCLFSVAPRRDCPFHPTRSRLVSVALIRTLRQAAVSCYGALWSPDFPRELKGSRDHRGELYPSRDCTRFRIISPLQKQKSFPNCYIQPLSCFSTHTFSKLFDFSNKNNKLSILFERLENSLTVHRRQLFPTF